MEDKLYTDATHILKAYTLISDMNNTQEQSEQLLETDKFKEYILTFGDIHNDKFVMPHVINSYSRDLYPALTAKKMVSKIYMLSLEDNDPVPTEQEEGVLLKVSAKLLKSITKILKDKIKKIIPHTDADKKKCDTVMKLLKIKAVAPKKDDAVKVKIVEAKKHVKELKKIATDAKKAADIAQKNYEKAEKVVEKLMMK